MRGNKTMNDNEEKNIAYKVLQLLETHDLNRAIIVTSMLFKTTEKYVSAIYEKYNKSLKEI